MTVVEFSAQLAGALGGLVVLSAIIGAFRR